jgi:hypothetical protein
MASPNTLVLGLVYEDMNMTLFESGWSVKLESPTVLRQSGYVYVHDRIATLSHHAGINVM